MGYLFIGALMWVSQVFAVPHLNLGWVPDGTRPRQLPDECSKETLQKIVLESSNSYARSQNLIAYFRDCQVYHTFMGETGLRALVQMFNLEYDYQLIPSVRHIVLKMRDGATINGVLALKPDDHPRPLVIVQCGLTCNTSTSPSVRWLLMHLYDETPFHVLAIGSSTTAEFAIANKRLFVGGLIEGRYLHAIAQWIRSPDSNLSQRVSSIHLQGMSLGGHGVLYGALYAQTDSSLIQSAQAFCPVVELKPSVDTILSSEMAAKFLQEKIWNEILKMVGKVPIIDRLLPDGKKNNPGKIREIIVRSSLEYLNPENLAVAHHLPKTEEEYWSASNFSILAANLQTPTLIWSSDDDPVVKSKDNSLKLLDVANQPNSAIGVLNTPTGSHCAFALSHGWDIYSQLMSSFVLAHSPEFLKNYHRHTKTLAEVQDREIKLAHGQRHFAQNFRLEEGNDSIEVTYQIFNPTVTGCESANPFLVDESLGCFDVQTAQISIAKLNIPFLRIPENTSVAEMLTRWANANLLIVDSQGQRVVNSRQTPVAVIWRELN